MRNRTRRSNQFDESAYLNNRTYLQYVERLTSLSISMFEWKNLPDSIDARFLEMTLFSDGQAVFFKMMYLVSYAYNVQLTVH